MNATKIIALIGMALIYNSSLYASDIELHRADLKPLATFLLIRFRFGKQQYEELAERFEQVSGLSYLSEWLQYDKITLSLKNKKNIKFKAWLDEVKKTNTKCSNIKVCKHEAIHTKWREAAYEVKKKEKSPTRLLESMYPLGRLIYKLISKEQSREKMTKYKMLLTPLVMPHELQAFMYNALRGPVTVGTNSKYLPLLHAVEKNLIYERKNKKRIENKENR